MVALVALVLTSLAAFARAATDCDLTIAAALANGACDPLNGTCPEGCHVQFEQLFAACDGGNVTLTNTNYVAPASHGAVAAVAAAMVQPECLEVPLGALYSEGTCEDALWFLSGSRFSVCMDREESQCSQVCERAINQVFGLCTGTETIEFLGFVASPDFVVAYAAAAMSTPCAAVASNVSFPSHGGNANISHPLLSDPCYLGFLAVASGGGTCNASFSCPAECHDELEGLLAICSESAMSGMMGGMLSGMIGGTNGGMMGRMNASVMGGMGSGMGSGVGGMSGMGGMMGSMRNASAGAGHGAPGQVITMFAPTGVELPFILASSLASRGSACASAPVDAFLESVGSNLTCSDSLALLSLATSPDLCGDSGECSMECQMILELPFGVCSATEELSVSLLAGLGPQHGLSAQELVAFVGAGLSSHCAAHLLNQSFEDGATHPCLVGVSSVFEGTLVSDSCTLAGGVCSEACAESLEGVIARCNGFTSPLFDYEGNHAPLPAGYMASEVILALEQEGRDACFVAPLEAVLRSDYQASCLDAMDLLYVANTVCWTHDIDQQECPEACRLMIDAPFELCESTEPAPEIPWGGVTARSVTLQTIAGPLGIPVPGGLSYACGDYASTKTFRDGGASPFEAQPSGTTEAPDADGSETTGKVAETTLAVGTPSPSPAPSPAPSSLPSPAQSPSDGDIELASAPRATLPTAALACAAALLRFVH